MRFNLPWAKSFQFLISFGSSLTVAFFILPFISLHYSILVWNSIAIGSSLGTLAAIVIEGGWNFNGPGIHQQSAKVTSQSILESALNQKMVTLKYVFPVLLLTSWIFSAHKLSVVTIAVSIAFATAGLNLNWIFVRDGLGKWVLLFDAFPRFVLSLVIIVCLITEQSIFVYPILMIISNLISPYLVHRYHRVNSTGVVSTSVFSAAKERNLAFKMNIIIGTYSSILVPAISIFALQDLAAFSLLDRVIKMTTGAAVAFLTPLQSWIFGPQTAKRARKQINHLSLGIFIFCLIGFALIIPIITTYMFPKIPTIPYSWWLLSALYVGVVILNRIYAFSILIPFGMLDFIFKQILYSSALFILAFCFVPHYGVIAALIAQLIRELSTLYAVFRRAQHLIF